MFKITQTDLDELAGWESKPVCFLCKSNGPFHMHHMIFRSHGGKEGDNLVRLCEVCHSATHGIKMIKKGFSCEVCRKRPECYFGQVVMGDEVVSEKPW